MKVLVVGGAGYIGSHTVQELLNNGHEVVVLDNLCMGFKEALPENATVYIGDKGDKEFLNEIFSKHQIDAVVDFAAYSQAGESMKEPGKYFKNNDAKTITLLNSMVENKCLRYVLSSTAAVYGQPQSVPIVETDLTLPINAYGQSKLIIENMLKWYDLAYGLKYVALRYFNAAGAHISGKIGEAHNPESHLIPLVLQTALEQREVISVFGTDYPTADGTCIRDYIHVTDLANAHVLALLFLEKENRSDCFNLGNGEGTSVLEIIKVAEEVTGLQIPVQYVERREGDPAVLIASSEKAINVLGWKPKYAEIKTIIGSAWEWHKNHPNGYKG